MYIRTNEKPNSKKPNDYKTSLINQEIYDRLCNRLEDLDSNMAEVRERLDKITSAEEWWEFHKFMIVRDTQGSLNLEGFKLNMDDAALQYNTAFVAQIPPESRKAMEGMFSAWNLLHRISERGTEVNKDLLLNIHTVLYGRLDLSKAGIFRNGYVRRPEFPKDFPAPSDLDKICNALIKKIEKSEDHPIVKAIFVEYSLWAQQFFWDGNSRTSRLVRDLLLAQEGYMQIPVPENYRGIYEKHRVNAGMGNPEGFYNFMLDMLEREINQTREFLRMEKYESKKKDVENLVTPSASDNIAFIDLWNNLDKQKTVLTRLVGSGDWNIEDIGENNYKLVNTNTGDTIDAKLIDNKYSVELSRGTTKRKFNEIVSRQVFIGIQFADSSLLPGYELASIIEDNSMSLSKSIDNEKHIVNILKNSDWSVSGARGKFIAKSISNNCFIEIITEGNTTNAKLCHGNKEIKLDEYFSNKIMKWAMKENDIAKRSREKIINGQSFENGPDKDIG